MTVKEVAELAGVSSSAISRYLNGGSLSAEKREKIRAAIEQTGYRPNPVGQMLRTGRMNQIGVIVPRIDSEAVGQVAAGIAAGLNGSRYLMLLGDCHRRETEELAYLDAMQENHVAGIILMGTGLTPAHRLAFENCRVPLVVTGQNFSGLPCVYHDDRCATRELAERMLQRGRRHIGYIGADEKDPAAGLARRLGVQDALNAAGLDGDAMPRRVADYTAAGGYACLLELLQQEPQLDGVVCATDRIALGAMSALKEQGKRLPEQVGVAGVGNNWAGTLTEPQLTTVDLYQMQCGQEAAGMLLRLLEQEDGRDVPIRQTRVGYRVLERGSL